MSEQFALVAITDHDRPDTAVALQRLAIAGHLPVLVAVEMTTLWKAQMVDILCFGFTPGQNALTDLAQDLARRQQENTREVYENLCRKGYLAPHPPDELFALLNTPSAQQPYALAVLVKNYGTDTGATRRSKLSLVLEAPLPPMIDITAVVDAAHRSGRCA